MKCLLSLLILTNWYIIQGVLEWTVIGKVTEYGQAATLFCNVSNCCPKYAGWDRWAPQRQTLLIDLKTARPNKKYDGKIYRDGYTLIIKNLTEKDLNISYSCIYGEILGERLFLFEEDVFTYTSTKQPNVSTGNRAFSDGEITVIIVGVIVLLAVPVVCIYLYCWRHRNFSTEGQVANTINSRVEYEKSQIANEVDSVVISDDDLDKNTAETSPLIDTVGKTPLIEISNDLKSMDSKEQGVFMKGIKFRKQIRRYVRVQVIGKHAVGKTCLVRRLLGKNLQDVHSTDGIDITKTCRISTKDGKWSVGEGGTERQETIWRLIQILKMKAEEQKELSSKEKKNESKVMPPIKDNNERNVNAVPKHDETSNDLTNDNNLKNPDGTIKLKKVEPIMENPKSDVNISEQMSLSDDNQESKISNEKMKEVIDEMGQIIALVQQQEAAMAYDGLVECGLWDFAGEKDYYVTHQTFLTPHAIYLLVASLKDDKIEVNGENYDNIEEYIDFWFDSIHCFCENSSDHENNLNPPVILVFTHTDEWLDPEEIAQQSGKKVMKKKEDYKQKIANIIGKRSDHIRGIFFLSNTQFGNEDINTIDQLKQLISNTAKEMEYFAEKLPMEWIQLENALAVLKRDLNTNILSMDNISDLAIKAIGGGIDITAFLNHQHKIGNLIFFDDIKDYIILQPNWLVQCFRCLICDDKKYNENITLLPTTALTQLTETGNISEEIIAKLFEKESHLKFGRYQNHILRVLEKFDIIVKPSFKGTLINECQKSNLYYMPCMISKTEALEIIKKKYANSFSASPWLTFEFEFLPLAFFNHILLYFVNDYIVCAEEDGEKRKAIYKGKALFCLDDSGFERLILCFSKNAISLQIWKEGEVEEVIYKNILEKLNRKIEELNNQLRLKITFTIKAKCSTGDYSKRAGRLSSEELDKKCRNGKYMCAEHEETHNKGEIWNTWLKHTSKSSKETNPMSPRLATPEDKDDNKIPYSKHGLIVPSEGATNGKIILYNTCCFDGFLVMIFIVLKFDPVLREQFKTTSNEMHQVFYNIWRHYERGEFSRGKILWCVYGDMIPGGSTLINLEGQERERIFSTFSKNRILTEIRCSENDCLSVIMSKEPHGILTIWKTDGKPLVEIIERQINSYLMKTLGGECRSIQRNGKECRGSRVRRIKYPPYFLPINLSPLRLLTETYSSEDLPETVQFNEHKYELKLVRLYKDVHFVDKLKVVDDWTYYDNKEGKLCYFGRDPKSSLLSSCFYVRKTQQI